MARHFAAVRPCLACPENSSHEVACFNRALESEPSIGLLLPCNVVVRQDGAGAVLVEFMDPCAVLELVNKPEITTLASEVRQKLERVMQAL